MGGPPPTGLGAPPPASSRSSPSGLASSTRRREETGNKQQATGKRSGRTPGGTMIALLERACVRGPALRGAAGRRCAVAVRERPPRYAARAASRDACPISERELAEIWEGQRFPPQALASVDGQPLTVLYRGLRGRGPGPDFRDAVIQTPVAVLRGDVELHLRASDFRRHGHHRDPAYDGLALHLVYRADEGPHTLLAGGPPVPIAALSPRGGRGRGGRPPAPASAAGGAPPPPAGGGAGRAGALGGEEAEEVLYRALMEA